MLKNYLLIAVRNLARNRFYTIVNILGLGVAMAMCVVASVNYQFSRSFDRIHQNFGSLYVLESRLTSGTTTGNSFQCPTPLAPALQETASGISHQSRLASTSEIVKCGDKVFNELTCYVDPEFFSMFSFPVVAGSLDAARERDGAVITDEIAARLYGTDSPIGQPITIVGQNRQEFTFVVGAVIKKPAINSTLILGVCLPYQRQADIHGFDLNAWSDWTSASFLMIDSERDARTVRNQLQNYVELTRSTNPNTQLVGFELAPFSEMSGLVREIGGPFANGFHPAALYMPTATALLILLLACFNFMNTSIASAARRIKEIGVRKALGGVQRQVFWQFVTENFLLCFVALLVASALAEVLVPAYDNLWPFLDFSLNNNTRFESAGFLLGLLSFVSIAAGTYPALYVSRLSPITILRGKQKLGGTNPVIRVLLTLQLALAVTTLLASLVLSRNAEYIRTFDPGYDSRDVLAVSISDQRQYQLLKDAALASSDVLSVGVTESLMGRAWTSATMRVNESSERVSWFSVGEGFLETMGISLLEGRILDPEIASDLDRAVVVNKLLAERQGWSSLEGKTVSIEVGDTVVEFNVVGMTEDFYPNGLNARLRPTVVRLTQPQAYQSMVIKCAPGRTTEVAAYVERAWKRLLPDLPYHAFWHDEIHVEDRDVIRSLLKVFLFVAVVGATISAMGLLALVSLNINRRTKEIGIRKVLGAGAADIGLLVSREFIVLILIGCVLASATGYYLLDMMLTSIWVYHCDFSVWPFVLATTLIFAMAAVAVGFHVYRAAVSNPTDSLRYE